MPGEERFGDELWDTFSRAHSADAYALAPAKGGRIAGGMTFGSSARRDAQVMHRIWSFLQDYETYDVRATPAKRPIPEYLIRYGRDGNYADLVFDVDEGWLSIYRTGEPESAKWISVAHARTELTEQFDHLFERSRVRDLRPNL